MASSRARMMTFRARSVNRSNISGSSCQPRGLVTLRRRTGSAHRLSRHYTGPKRRLKGSNLEGAGSLGGGGWTLSIDAPVQHPENPVRLPGHALVVGDEDTGQT